MGMAWTDGYWISYSLTGNPRLSFDIPTTGATIWPWTYITDAMRFDVIKAILDTNWVWVEWNDTTRQIIRIVSLKRFP